METRMKADGGETLADDLLDGADEIAEFTGWTRRRVFYLLEKGQLPAFKVGKKWCARRTTLTQFISKLEAGEVAA